MKFVLDTNVVSELMRPAPSRRVTAWIASHSAEQMYLTSVIEAELRYGIAILPPGDRRTQLAKALDAMFADDFQNDALPFDSAAARVYADELAEMHAANRMVPTLRCRRQRDSDCAFGTVESTAQDASQHRRAVQRRRPHGRRRLRANGALGTLRGRYREGLRVHRGG